MKCKHCGMEVNKGLKYCNNCGQPVENTDSNIKNLFQKIPKKYLYIGAGVVLSLAALLLILANRTTTIRLDKYIQADIEGYDGYGTADLYIDWEKIESKYGDKISLIKGTSASASAQFAGLFTSEVDEMPLEILKDSVEIEVDKTSGLSNGDTITCTIHIDDEYEPYVDCRMKADREVEYKVSTLQSVMKFDAFANLTMEISGVSPFGDIDFTYEGEEFSQEDFYYEDQEGWAEGDSVTVTVSDEAVRNCASKYGKVPENNEKKYTVSGLSTYVAEIADINESGMTSLKQQAEDAYEGLRSAWNTDETTYKGMDYLGSYVLSNKGSGWYSGGHNRLYLVFRISVKNFHKNEGKKYNKTNDIYWYVCYKDIYVNNDGDIQSDILSYSTPDHTFTVDSGIEDGTWFGTKTWSFEGYSSLEELRQSNIQSYAENYTISENIEDIKD